jgi:phosphoglycolate phosphatase-like HAD superfamily hydrolase
MRLVVSDLDGVLADSSELYARAVEELLERRGIRWEHETVIATRVPHVQTWLDSLLPEALPDRDDLVRELTVKVRARMVEQATESPLHPDARAVLSTVAAKYPLYLLSNSTARFALGVLDHHRLTPLFERVITSDDGFAGKSGAIAHLAEARGCSVRDIVLVGDTLRDVTAANQAGCLSIVVYSEWSWDWGNLAALEAAGPTLIVHGLSEVPGALERVWS